ncbi:MAG: glycosyltransferase family 9 protein [Crocinitomicaceae bacterium]
MKKVLIVRFSSIGDIVLTSPVVRALKSQLDDVEIHYLTKESYKEIVNNNPNIEKVYTIKNKVAPVLTALKNEEYDFVIDLHHNLRTKRIKFALSAKNSSFPKLNIRKFLLTQFKINKMPKVHIVDRYFSAAKPLGVKNDHQGLDFFIPKEDEVNLASVNVPDQFIAFAIGAQFATKQLPVKSIIEVVGKIDQAVVLLGGESDVNAAKEISQACKNTIDFCGKLSLNQSASIVKQAQKVISHDTGLMHIAAAFNKPIISIWGNTVPDLGMYPYMPKNETDFSIHEVNHLKCRPCSKIGHQACPKKHFGCMLEQDLDAIAEDVKS